MTRRSSALILVIAWVAGIAAAGAVAFAAVTIVPQIVRATSLTVAEHDTTVILTGPGASARIPVAADWSYSAAQTGDGRTTLYSPNAVMTVDLTAIVTDDAEAAVRAATGAATTPFDREPVGEATVIHASLVGDDAIVGAVVDGDRAVLFTSRPAKGYDA